MLVHLRGRVVDEVKSRWSPERLAMDALAKVFGSRGRYERAQRLARAGNGPLARHLPGTSGWTAMRELPDVPRQSFREWWAERPAAERGRRSPRADTAGRSHGGPPA